MAGNCPYRRKSCPDSSSDRCKSCLKGILKNTKLYPEITVDGAEQMVKDGGAA